MLNLRQYQIEAVDSAWRQLKTKDGGNPLIVLPTGAGKSIVIASIAMDAVKKYAGRVVILQHRKELIEQNAEKVKRLCDVPVGLYSAGLNRKQINEDIIVAGIQSIYKKACDLGRRQLAIIDEVHLLPDDGVGMYREFLESLGTLNPNLKIVGLTATPYRTDSGKLYGTAESFFKGVTYEAGIRDLIDSQFLCSVTSTSSIRDADTSKLRMRAGEFKLDEMAMLFDENEIVSRACEEIVDRSHGRHSCLIFCSSVNHSWHVAQEITRITGEECGNVVGETNPLERASTLSRFKERKLKWLTNCSVLTTGFDAPCIDLIAIMRATASPGLFAQICGRGLRTDPTKRDCVILDFGGNIKRHGPIDAINFNARAKSNSEQDAPQKRCPGCRELVHAAMRTCTCGFAFPKPEVQHDDTPDDAEILSIPISFEVTHERYALHEKKNAPDAPPTFRVDYSVVRTDDEGDLEETQLISEWVCLEHPPGFARNKAIEWWRKRSSVLVPDSVADAIDVANQGALAKTKSIVARRDGRWWRITQHEMFDVPDQDEFIPVGDYYEEDVPF